MSDAQLTLGVSWMTAQGEIHEVTVAEDDELLNIVSSALHYYATSTAGSRHRSASDRKQRHERARGLAKQLEAIEDWPVFYPSETDTIESVRVPVQES